MCVSIIYRNTLYYAFSEVFKLCETETLNFAVYFMIDRHSYEQVHLKVEPKSFLYEFLNSGDPLYYSLSVLSEKFCFLEISPVYQKLQSFKCTLLKTLNSNFLE